MEDKYLDYSNADLRIKLMTLENEYEALKSKIRENVEKMQKLDNEFITIKEVLKKRTGGRN